MIRYALACDNGHDFESWFPSGAAYDEQVTRGLVECPACGSRAVEKRIMAPALGKRAAARSEDANAAAPSPPEAPQPQTQQPQTQQPVAILSEREQAMRAMLRAVREHVTKTADYVGPGFAEEARRMHYGETEHRSIYGEANPRDAKALMEEGIEVHALPFAPEDRN